MSSAMVMLLVWGTAAAQAGDPSATGNAHRPIFGCGKARMAMARSQGERDLVGDALMREAMGDTDVLHYALDIEVSNLDPANNTCTISGTNTITIQSKSAALTEFTFRLRSQYSITSATVDGTPVQVSTPTATTRVVTLDRTYSMDEVFDFVIAYNGNSLSGGFGSIEVDTQFGTPVVATLSEPYYAHTWWPAKDGDLGQPGDNSDKATLDFTITVPGGYTVPSNGVLVSTEALPGNRTRYRWTSSYPIAPYLISFAATDYNTWTQTYVHPGGTMPVEFYIYPGNDNAGNRAAWETALDMLPVFSQFYGEYPFIDEKYGIYNFNFGGGMEHQTMTGMGTFLEWVNAHELAHQWWGDWVTCRTWGDIWLNEGFATFSECLWEEHRTGVPDLQAYLAAVQARRPFFVGDSVYVYDTSSVSRIFSWTFSYLKGCWVLHQLRGLVGDATFFQMLADYRAAFGGGAATTDDFAAVASTTYGADLTWFFDQWVYQAGAPEYRYAWQSAQVNGQDYLALHLRQIQGGGYPNPFVMSVDVAVTIGAAEETVTVWNDASDEWFVVPVGGPVTAVQFDPDEWILRTGAATEIYLPGPPKIVGTSPAPGKVVEEAAGVAGVSITFHTGVLSAVGDYALVGQNTGPYPLSFAYDGVTQTATLSAGGPLPPDTYIVTAADTITGLLSGAALDGEVSDPLDNASLPSGDGLPGGSAVFEFAVVCAFGDADCDGSVDLRDFAVFQECFTGPDGIAAAGCEAMRIDADRDVDLDDYDAFAALLTAP